MRWILCVLIFATTKETEICHQTTLVDLKTCHCQSSGDTCDCLTEIDNVCVEHEEVNTQCSMPLLNTQFGCLPERLCSSDEEEACHRRHSNWQTAACRAFIVDHCECEMNQHPCVISCAPNRYFICHARTVITEEQTDILVDILGPTFDSTNSSSSVAGELTVNLFYAIVISSRQVATLFEWSSELSSKYTTKYVETSSMITNNVILAISNIKAPHSLKMSKVEVVQFYCLANGTHADLEVLYISNLTSPVKELGVDGISRHEDLINYNATLLVSTFKESLDKMWPNALD